MKFTCQTTRLEDGGWLVRHSSTGMGTVETRGASREEALRKMRDELRYRLEYCPCTGELYQDVGIEIEELSGR